MDGLDAQLAAVAAQQHCLIALRDVRAAGGNAKQAERRVDTGRWEQVFDGVYRLAGVPWTWEARVMALVLAGGPDAVASHLCACRLHGLGFGTALPEISVPRSRNFRAKDHLIRTSTDLDRCSIVTLHGIPTTDPARTLLDIGRFVGSTVLTKTVAKARKKDLVDWHGIAVCLAAHARKGRHGVKNLREVVAAGAVNDGISDTDSELIALTLLREHGFEEPTLQHRLYDSFGQVIAEMDIAYVGKRIDFEIDGPIHLLPEVIAKDDARDHLVHGLGWTVRRIWYEIPVHEPRKFIEIVRNTLRGASV
ncbi:MAG: hypothetical protein QOI61_2453 [Actinomycetota bacterium]